jgi:phasin family protein
MYAEMISAVSGSMRNVFGPAQKVNELVVAHLEKVAAIQLESAKSLANLGIAQMKAAGAVNDPWSVFGFMAKQGTYATKLGEQLVADAQKMRELSGDFMEKAQTVAKEEARAIGGALAETRKVSAKKAA